MKNKSTAIFSMIVLFCLLYLLWSCSMPEMNNKKILNTEVTPEEETKNNNKTPGPSESDEDEEIPGDNFQLPVLLNSKSTSEREAIFEFSLPVKIVHLNSIPDRELTAIEEGNTVKVTFTKKLEPGQQITANLTAEDEYGNVFDISIPFRVRNTRVPKMQINELRTEYSGASLKAEFIEFKIFSDGNLGALRIFAAGNYKAPMIYEFTAIEVTAGEYVVLHLRTLEQTCKDEYSNILNESGGTDSNPASRDLWIPGSNKLLHKTDAVYILDQDDNILDAIMIAEKPAPSWDKSYFTEAAEFLFNEGAWKPATGTIPSPLDAVDSSGIKSALTKSISRDETEEDTNTAKDWFVTNTGGVSPGQSNSLKPL